MTTIFTKKTGKIVSGIALLSMLLVGFSLPEKAHAATVTGDMHGYAWAPTIGWISLNCAEGGTGGTSNCSTTGNYKVKVTADNLSGYAWSDDLGWISFNSASVATCGSGGAGILNDTTGNITGWARALSGTPGTPNNGCISLGGTGYGVHYDATTFSTAYPSYHPLTGFAWGDATIGWTDFAYAALDGATVAPNIFCAKNTLFPDQTFVPGTTAHPNPHRKIAEYFCKNKSLTESIGFTNLTIGVAPVTLGLSDLTNLKVTFDGGSMVGTNLPVVSASNVRSVAPKTLGPSATVFIQLWADIGSDPSGSFSTDLLAQATGLTSGTAYTSGAAVQGQNNTISPLPPNAVDFKVNGVPLYTFGNSAAGPVTFTWSAGSSVSSCTAARDTIDSSETYWDAGHPSPVVLPSGFLGPVTVPANTTHSMLAHVYALNCITGAGPHTETVEVDVPPVTPHVDLKVNGVDGPITMPYGGAVSLSWSTTDVTSCGVDNDMGSGALVTDPTYWVYPSASTFPLNQPLPPGWVVVTPTAPGTYKYGIVCHGPGIPPAGIKDAVQIVITPSTALPGTSPSGGTGGVNSLTRPPWHEI